MKTKGNAMGITEALEVARRLESIVRRADTFGPKTRAEILEEIADMALDFRALADKIDFEMDELYLQENA